MSTALGLWEYGIFLYTASRIFSLTCVMVSQFRTLTGISGLFSFSGLTQFKIWRGKKEDEDDKMLGCGWWSRRCRAGFWKRPFPGLRNLISHPLQDPNLSLSRVWETNEHYPPSARLPDFIHTCSNSTDIHESLLDTMFISVIMRVCDADQRLVVDLLPDEFVFAEGVSGLAGDGVYWTFFHLLFYSTVEHKQRLASTLLHRETERGHILHFCSILFSPKSPLIMLVMVSCTKVLQYMIISHFLTDPQN